MRVIKIGHIEEREAFCYYCGAEIGYFPADERHKRVSNYYVTLLNCPVCGNPIVLEKTENPCN